MDAVSVVGRSMVDACVVGSTVSGCEVDAVNLVGSSLDSDRVDAFIVAGIILPGVGIDVVKVVAFAKVKFWVEKKHQVLNLKGCLLRWFYFLLLLSSGE